MFDTLFTWGGRPLEEGEIEEGEVDWFVLDVGHAAVVFAGYGERSDINTEFLLEVLRRVIGE